MKRLGRPSARPGTSRCRYTAPFLRMAPVRLNSRISLSAWSSSSHSRAEKRGSIHDRLKGCGNTTTTACFLFCGGHTTWYTNVLTTYLLLKRLFFSTFERVTNLLERPWVLGKLVYNATSYLWMDFKIKVPKWWFLDGCTTWHFIKWTSSDSVCLYITMEI